MKPSLRLSSSERLQNSCSHRGNEVDVAGKYPPPHVHPPQYCDGGRVGGCQRAHFLGAALAIVSLLGAAPSRAAEATAPAQSFSAPAKDSPEMAWWREAAKTRDERLQWWREARFGMFVHWGVYAGLGNQFEGRKGGGYAEHVQRVLKIPIPVYREQVAGKFNPTEFNADDWIRAASQAGMGYFIITSKHHDGFAMWPTKVNNYNVMDATPWHHDPMKDLRAACKKYGVRFGFYYSHAFDWGNENAPGNDWDYQNPGGDKLIGGRNWWETRADFLPTARKYVDEKSIPQLQELIRTYDPDILWFDTPSKLPESENARIMRAVRTASSRVVINGRLVGGLGDYASTADRPAEFAPHEGDWEGIPTTNESYGWNPLDNSHKPPLHFIQLLAKAAARGGNTLMNVGPMGNGRIDPKDLAILEGIGAWWKVNGESIRGSTRTPLPVQAWGESTRKGNTLYLHVFNWPTNGTLVVGGLKSDIKRAWLLAEQNTASRTTLRARRLNSPDVKIDGLPAVAPDQADSVIALECADPIATDSTRLLQPVFANDTLRIFDAQLHGRGLKFGPGKTRDAYVIGWSRDDESITWPLRLNEAGTFDMDIVYDAPGGSAGGTYDVSLGSETFHGTVKSGTMQTTSLGRVSLKPGNAELKLSAGQIKSNELMRPRAIVLKTVAP